MTSLNNSYSGEKFRRLGVGSGGPDRWRYFTDKAR